MERNKVVHGSGTLVLKDDSLPVRYKMCLSLSGSGDIEASVVLENADEALESTIYALADGRARLVLADGQEIDIALTGDGWSFFIEGQFPEF